MKLFEFYGGFFSRAVSREFKQFLNNKNIISHETYIII